MQFHKIHPGVTLKEELEARGISPAAAALKLRVPPQRLHEIVRGERAITPDTALRLSRFFGTSAEFWLTLQTNYDLALARNGGRGSRPRSKSRHDSQGGTASAAHQRNRGWMRNTSASIHVHLRLNSCPIRFQSHPTRGT